MGTASTTIDDLTYTYQDNSNKLLSVKDPSNTATAKLGDFIDKNQSGNDYDYNGNGNLIKDLNKNISTIIYNYLNLPEQITILENNQTKGTITYQYSATGVKLRKTVIDNSVSPAITTISDYDGIFMYKKDTLQYIAHEEGRIRPVYDSGKAVKYVWDYFEKDHLGNTRIVLGTQTDTSVYAATMETAKSVYENALFANIDNTRDAIPAGYPADATTNPNAFVAKLNAVSGQKVGPSIVLRVMAGDTIQLGVKAFYKSIGTSTSSATSESILSALAQAFSGSSISDGTHGVVDASSALNTSITPANYDQLKSKNPAENLSNKPKAYLNYVLFDDMFNMVDENSGVKQVQGSPDELQTLTVGKTAIKKTGFLYIYTSNESGENVYFDNLVVSHNSGPLLEETHYYPFGLTMEGISSAAIKGAKYAENRMKYNGKELQSGEFSDKSGLEWYDYGARMQDPQIGRWMVLDPLSEKMRRWSPYNYAFDNPIRFIDPDGRQANDIRINGDATFRQKSFEALQKATNDKLVLLTNGQVVKSGSKEISLSNTEIIGQPSKINSVSTINITASKSTKIVSDLISSNKTTWISETLDGNATSAADDNAASLKDDGSKGTGSDVYIYFNAYNTEASTDVNGGHQRPTFLGLIHEMIHATHMVNGQVDNKSSGKQDPEITNKVHLLDNEELNTRKEENIIRAEHNLPNRILPK